jgi:hypothetical protein
MNSESLQIPMDQLPSSTDNRYRVRLRYRRHNSEVIPHNMKQAAITMNWKPVSIFNLMIICSLHRHTHHRYQLISVQCTRAPLPTWSQDLSLCFPSCQPHRMNLPRLQYSPTMLLNSTRRIIIKKGPICINISTPTLIN